MDTAEVMAHGIAEAPLAWEAYEGKCATVHVPRQHGLAARAHEILRESDALILALRKLLAPADDDLEGPVAIYLTSGAAAATPDGAATDLPADAPSESAIALEIPIGLQAAEMSKSLVRRLVAHWFGPQAATADPIVDGIAGLVAAQADAGPTIEEADRIVDSELRSHRPVAIVGRHKNGLRRRRGETACREASATSFVAYLAATFGSDSLRRYLVAYDPARHDQAAAEVLRQPLSLLEEEWIARRRRQASEGDVFFPFMRYVLPLLRPYRWRLLEIFVYLLLASAYNVVLPYSVKVVIDRLNSHARAGSPESRFVEIVAPLLALLLTIYLVNGVVSLRRAYTVSRLNQDILNSLQIRMYAHLHRLSHEFYVNAKIGDLMARIGDDLDIVQSALSQVTNKALYQSFTAIGAVTALFILTRRCPVMAVPILLIVPLFAGTYVALRTRNKQASREQRKRVGQTMATVQESLSAHALIKAFGLEQRSIADYHSRIMALQKSKIRLALLGAVTDLTADMTTAFAQLIVIGVGGYLVLRDGRGGMGIGDLAALLVLVKSIFSPIASLAGIGQTMQQATGAMERVAELFQEPVKIEDRPGSIEASPLSSAVVFENITFTYGGDRRALRDLCLTLPAGAHVAIVGPSGAGKSSLVNLLLRFWDPERGRVLFDGRDLRDISLRSLRGQIGLVFQETLILNTTLRANIAVGRPDATDAEIAAAATKAHLSEFIDTLPAGYDTIAGESGARLSTGQKQRIAIARAFLRDPPILVLDEATSALDANTEAEILETLSELAQGRTTISITHRISQAATADLIFVLDEGRLVGKGNHAELVRAGGLYRKLYDEATGFVTAAA